MNATQDNIVIQIPYLPSGQPCPAVMTGDEVAELFRLEGNSPERTLKYFRDEGQLVGFRLGRKVRYRLEDVLTFLERKSGQSAM